MRPVNKNKAPRVYRDYGEARHDLANIIGYYCSYCEMKVFNSIEVEHILPKNQGGAPVDWDNFLLSCKYCNTIKSDKNKNLTDYLWPDMDNTDLVFEYSQVNVVEAKTGCTQIIKKIAKNTIQLMGLDRVPGGSHEPTVSDTRWRSREETWTKAKESYNNWNQLKLQQMADQIAITASTSGHYSIWMEVFKAEQMVLDAIDAIYKDKGLYKEFDQHGTRVIRPNGRI